ncbi:hypothetical protein PBY51_023216 [Eleginops maclovinus]|uniref:RING-type domain-containing protein n=1 Tax=Eleginops maclovinus TaxID=56733 RepID=A0AAN7X0E6_ELEMC|nr:hypothetical protein PBY51_023216 [Eleginops maclovinus]
MSQRERTILRCRRCRKGVIDSTCLSTTGATDESSEAGCSIWHVDVDMLPEWILTSVHQAQWTVGKLYCQNCGARLGGFNFINHSECPCGRDAAVHLSKSRVDRDHKHCVLIVQPRRRTSEKEQSALLTDDCQSRERRMDFNSLHLNCAAQASSDNPPSFSFSPLYCISHRRRRSLEEDASIRSSCFCPTVRSAVQRPRTGEYTPVSYPTSQRFDSEGEASFIACRPFVSARTRSPLLQRVQDAESFPETSSVHQNVPVPALFLRGSSVSDSVAEGEEGDEEEEEEAVVVPDAFMAPLASNRLSRREKNRLKSIRRKQRRRERWLHSQQEQAESVSHSLSEGEDLDREGLTCAVCLEVYFSPYSCQPCAHVFCEPCLRTIGKNRPTNTPCPLCRALISHTTLHKELDQTAKTFFPKAYHARKQSFQSAACAKWPLPSCRKRYRAFWGEQRQAALAGRRWHFSLGGFTMDALDFGGVRGWLFDNGLVMVYISVNWILATFFSFFFMYFFFF